MPNRYLEVPYIKFGRTMEGADCYGLVRMARHDLLGLPLLPLHDSVSPDDKKEMTETSREIVKHEGLIPCAFKVGAIATAWVGRLCIHVGLVIEADGRLWVLETDQKKGPCLTMPNKFEARYTNVIYYANN